MPRSLQELSDRLDIQDLQAAYSHAIDTRDFDALDRVFTPDAFIDYSAFGGSAGGLKETKAFLAKALAMFGGFQHMVATSQVKLSGNRATAKTICWNPMVVKRPGGEEHVFFCGLWYHDEYLRTLDGWRMTKRVEEKSFTHNMPPEFLNPEAAMKKRGSGNTKPAVKKPAAKAKAPAKNAKKPAAKNRKK
ncbi:MAG TPA: nuclear transport factor 2 family protein [Myxococcota bacterium]